MFIKRYRERRSIRNSSSKFKFEIQVRKSVSLSERTVILNSCDDCSTPNEHKLRKCTSCGRDIFQAFDFTIEGAVAEMRLKVQQESALTFRLGFILTYNEAIV